MIRLISVLGLICFVASLVLGVTYHVTAPIIEAQEFREENEALRAVMAEADEFKPRDLAGEIRYFEAYAKGQLIGYCVPAQTKGYSSVIRMTVGIDTKGIIRGLKILSQQETPGLGARILEVKSGQTEPWFSRQFAGKDAALLGLSDIDGITGATISSRAVVNGVRENVETLLERIR